MLKSSTENCSIILRLLWCIKTYFSVRKLCKKQWKKLKTKWDKQQLQAAGRQKTYQQGIIQQDLLQDTTQGQNTQQPHWHQEFQFLVQTNTRLQFNTETGRITNRLYYTETLKPPNQCSKEEDRRRMKTDGAFLLLMNTFSISRLFFCFFSYSGF